MKEPSTTSEHPLERPPASGSPAFALISTLLIIAVLTIMVIAFMQSMRVDRLTARSYLDKYRADLAAQSGLDYAVAQMRIAVNDTNTGKGDFAFTTEYMTDTNSTAPYSPVLILSRHGVVATNAAQKTRTITPLISGSNSAQFSITNADVVTPTALTNIAQFTTARNNLFTDRRTNVTVDLNWGQVIQSTNTYGTNANTNSYYRAAFLPLTNAAGKVGSRFAYTVIDEQSKLNAQFHRAAARDNYGTNANEIPLSTGGTNLFTPSEQAAYLAATSAPASSAAALRFVATNRVNSIRQFFGSSAAVDLDVIPAGYADAGKPKYNINDLATNTAFGATATLRAENMATIIDQNIPTFKTRDPSLASQPAAMQKRYLNRLCASIVDYIDADTEITTVNGGEPAGRDLFPLVTTVAEYYNAGTETPSGSGYQTTISSRGYVQIWNPYTVPVTGSARLLLKNRKKISYGADGIVVPLNEYSPTAVENITVQPNEFVVVPFPTVTQTFTSPTGPNTVSAKLPRWLVSQSDNENEIAHEAFEFEWNGQRVDMTRNSPVLPAPANAGMVRNTKNLAFGAPHYQVSAIPTYNHLRTVGDPRFTYLSNYDWPSLSADGTYGSSTYWKGRNRDAFDQSQHFVQNWALRDYIRVNPVMGTTPGSVNNAPDSKATPYVFATESPNAPMYIRNAPMLSIGELGNIFDPIQADNTGAAPSGGSSPASVFVAGGGRTLRIGQPEFTYLNSKGKRATELLDLFTTNVAPTAGGYPEMRGRVNINTAPVEVLQALLYNIEVKSDEGFADASNTPIISKMDTATSATLAAAIVTERNNSGIFTSTSDLYRLPALGVLAGAPLWNKANAYAPQLGAGAATSAPEVMDRAREELFAKMINLVSVQSRGFKVYATGQALGPTGKIMARSNLQALIQFEQGTDSSGNAILIPRVVFKGFY